MGKSINIRGKYFFLERKYIFWFVKKVILFSLIGAVERKEKKQKTFTMKERHHMIMHLPAELLTTTIPLLQTTDSCEQRKNNTLTFTELPYIFLVTTKDFQKFERLR